MVINPLQALHYANPEALAEIVGFPVATFYDDNDNNTVFWERLPDSNIGRVKRRKKDFVMKEVINMCEKIREEYFERVEGERDATRTI